MTDDCQLVDASLARVGGKAICRGGNFGNGLFAKIHALLVVHVCLVLTASTLVRFLCTQKMCRN